MNKKKTKTKNKINTMVQQKLALVVVIIALFLLANAFGGFVLKSFKEVRQNNRTQTTATQELRVCDHNYDGKVDLIDIGLFSSCESTFDANGDGIHNLEDIAHYAANYQDTNWCRTAVPECGIGNKPILDRTEFGLFTKLPNKLYYDYSVKKWEDLAVHKSLITTVWYANERSPGEYNWDGLDAKIINFAEDANTAIFLRILAWGESSATGELNWYCDPDMSNQYSCVFTEEGEERFQTYVDTLTKRYAGKIDKIQFGNEWGTPWHFIGTAQDHTKYNNWVYDLVKKNSPNTVVSLGGITKGALSYKARCLLDETDPNFIDEVYTEDGTLVPEDRETEWCTHVRSQGKYDKVKYVLENAKYDVADMHVYDDPQYWDEYLGVMETMTSKPILITEFGGPEPDNIYINPKDEIYQAEELRKYINKILELGVSEAYFFQFIQGPDTFHDDSGLVKVESRTPYVLKEKPTYYVFKHRYDTDWQYGQPPTSNLEFGLNAVIGSAEEIEYSLDIMDDLGISKTRIWENWIFREPNPGQYRWPSLDTRVNEVYDDGKNFVMTIKPVGVQSGSVAWYCQDGTANLHSCLFKPEYEDDFAKYIKGIIERYPGKIDKIQFQNEWETDYHFIGTGEDYTRYANLLYDTVKKYSPDTTVVLGSITKGPLLYLAGCELSLLPEFYDKTGRLIPASEREAWCNDPEAIAMKDKVAYVFANAKYDMVDIHVYDDPEYWDEYIQALQSLLGKKNTPIIVTEFGGPWHEDQRIDPYNENDQASELLRYLNKLTELPIIEAYYFRIIEGEGESINHPLTGLMRMIEGQIYPVKKLNYDVFKNFINQR